MRPLRRATAALLALGLVGAGGCISSESCEGTICGPLPPAITARVLDAVDGGVVHSAVVNGFSFDCTTPCPVQLPDGGFPEAAGTFPLSVSAPGYLSQVRVVDVPPRMDDSCCPLPFEPQEVDVALVRL